MSRGHRAVFWDRDGTLMDEVDYCDRPGRVRAIAGAGEALHALSSAGWLNVIVTNQSGIARGYFTIEDYESVNAELFRQLGIAPDGVYCAPDDPKHPTPRRKPGIGMISEACRDLGIDPSFSVMVGDKAGDIWCGRNAGCRTVLVLTGYGLAHRDCGADHIAEDAAAAAAWILTR